MLTWIWWAPFGLCMLGFSIWHFKDRIKKASKWTFQINDEWIHVQEEGGKGIEFAGSLSSMSFVTSETSLSIADRKSGLEVQIEEIEAGDLERMSSFLERLPFGEK